MNLVQYTIPINSDGKIVMTLPGVNAVALEAETLFFNPNEDSFKMVTSGMEILFTRGQVVSVVIRHT